MHQNHPRAFAQPRHIFDIAALTALGLAAAGNGALRLARAIDRTAAARRNPHTAEKLRPRDRLGPPPATRRFEQAEHRITDSWRIR